MSMYDKNHYNIVISLQLIKINEKKLLVFSNILIVNSEEVLVPFDYTDSIVHSQNSIQYTCCCMK